MRVLIAAAPLLVAGCANLGFAPQPIYDHDAPLEGGKGPVVAPETVDMRFCPEWGYEIPASDYRAGDCDPVDADAPADDPAPEVQVLVIETREPEPVAEHPPEPKHPC